MLNSRLALITAHSDQVFAIFLHEVYPLDGHIALFTELMLCLVSLIALTMHHTLLHR